MDVCRWRFPSVEGGEIKGINDAGVETFGSNTLRSLVRESLQNSIDAGTGTTVGVEFEEMSISFQDIPDHEGLREALRMCLERGCDDSEAATRFFRRALEVANGRSLRVMRISDHNTTGLRGAKTCEMGTDWSKLIKESGSSNKGGAAGGSFGIGKYANFACSDLRSVFFSSVDDAGYASHIGVSRLISYRTDEHGGSHTTSVGYYANSSANNAIYGQIGFGGGARRTVDDPGTDIYVLGFRHEGDTTKEILKYVLTDFLVSVWKGKLAVTVNGQKVDAHNLGSYVSQLNDHDELEEVRETIYHYELLTKRSPSIHVIDFDPAQLRQKRAGKQFGWGEGSCRLYLMGGGDKLNRQVTYTRAAGMRIFNQKSISGSICFTGILMIEGDKMNADFNDIEAPSHDEWTPDRAEDPARARKMVKALRDWVRDSVLKALAVEVENEVEAFGTALYLPRRAPQEQGTAAGEERQESLEAPLTVVRQRDITPRTVDRVITVKADVTADEGGDAIRKGDGVSKRGTKPVRGLEGGTDRGYIRVPIRQRLVCSDRSTGTYRLSFVVPHDAKGARVALCIEGERGEEYVNVRSAEVYADGPREVSIKGNTIAFEDVSAGQQVRVTFTTGFPHYCMMGADYYEAK